MWDNFFKDWNDDFFKYEKVKKKTEKFMGKVYSFYRDACNDVAKFFKWDDK